MVEARKRDVAAGACDEACGAMEAKQGRAGEAREGAMGRWRRGHLKWRQRHEVLDKVNFVFKHLRSIRILLRWTQLYLLSTILHSSGVCVRTCAPVCMRLCMWGVLCVSLIVFAHARARPCRRPPSARPQL